MTMFRGRQWADSEMETGRRSIPDVCRRFVGAVVVRERSPGCGPHIFWRHRLRAREVVQMVPRNARRRRRACTPRVAFYTAGRLWMVACRFASNPDLSPAALTSTQSRLRSTHERAHRTGIFALG